MKTDKVGDGSWADVPSSSIRLFAELEPTGWAFSAYDLELKLWIVRGQSATDERHAREIAESWVYRAGLMKADKAPEWKRR